MRILLALPVLATGVCAQAQSGPSLPDRPAIALARYQGGWATVVGTEAGSPVALDNGGKVTLPANSGILLSVGDRFADGFVTVADPHSTELPETSDPDMTEDPTVKTNSGAENYEANLTSDIDLPDAYALFVIFTPSQKADLPQGLAILVRPIGDLQAGKQMHLTVRLPKLSQEGGPDWTLLAYTAGREVRSTGMSGVLPAYFDRIETSALNKRIAERAEKGANAPIAVFREMPLGLPGAIETRYHGSTVKVKVEVDTRGRVVSAKPVGLDDPQLSEAVEKGFGSWLFLPPVKEGAAEPGTAIVPLKM